MCLRLFFEAEDGQFEKKFIQASTNFAVRFLPFNLADIAFYQIDHVSEKFVEKLTKVIGCEKLLIITTKNLTAKDRKKLLDAGAHPDNIWDFRANYKTYYQSLITYLAVFEKRPVKQNWTESPIQFADFKLIYLFISTTDNPKPLKLSEIQYRILAYILTNGYRIIGKTELLKAIFEGTGFSQRINLWLEMKLVRKFLEISNQVRFHYDHKGYYYFTGRKGKILYEDDPSEMYWIYNHIA